MWDQRVHAGPWICYLTCVTYMLHVNVYGTVDTCSLLTPYRWIWKKMSLCCLILWSMELEASGWVKGADEDAFTPAEKHRTPFWWNLWPVVRIYNDAACLTSSRVGHISVQFVRPPRSLFVELKPAEKFVDWNSVGRIPGQENFRRSARCENKKTNRVHGDPTQSSRGGDGPRVCTAACHQRAVKMRRTDSWLFFLSHFKSTQWGWDIFLTKNRVNTHNQEIRGPFKTQTGRKTSSWWVTY